MKADRETGITAAVYHWDSRIWVEFPRERQDKGFRLLPSGFIIRLEGLAWMPVEHTPQKWNVMFMFCEDISEINSIQNMLNRCGALL